MLLPFFTSLFRFSAKPSSQGVSEPRCPQKPRRGLGGEGGKQAGVPLPLADTGAASCGLRSHTQFGFKNQVLRNYQASFGRRGEQLRRHLPSGSGTPSWELLAVRKPPETRFMGDGSSSSKHGLQEPGVTSALPHERWEPARLREQTTALLPAPNPPPPWHLPTAKGPTQNHL